MPFRFSFFAGAECDEYFWPSCCSLLLTTPNGFSHTRKGGQDKIMEKAKMPFRFSFLLVPSVTNIFDHRVVPCF